MLPPLALPSLSLILARASLGLKARRRGRLGDGCEPAGLGSCSIRGGVDVGGEVSP